MNGATPISRRTLFGLRRAFRAGQLTAVLDATSYDNLLATIGASRLTFESLFSGEDAIMLSGEAPYVVALDPDRPKAVRDLIKAANHRHAGFVAQSDASLDDLRRHFAGRLHVIINEGQDMALFRFYDTRILLAFLASLTTTEAAAFWGPVDQAYVARGAGIAKINMPLLPGASVATDLEPAEGDIRPPVLQQINSNQMEQMSKVTDTVFRERLQAYLTTEWGGDVGDRTPDEVQDLIGASIADCARLEVCREMDIVTMAIVRMRKPALVASDEFWEAVIAQKPNPNQRSGAFLGRIIIELEPDAAIAFYQRLNGWWEFGKAEEEMEL
ncbi:DUF4123 domain-containing protein [Yoonia sp. R2331]|uniref:DUF4123 domain-containing protein n=1 Tax=Yoonia sp. R2331 TaxID=3237238 RepID=UPI0034E41400